MHLIDWGACTQDPNTGQDLGFLTLNCLPALFHGIIQALLSFVGLASVIYLIIAGFKYITAQGDAKQLGSARSTMTFALIGLIVVLMSFLFLTFISQITGVQCLTSLNFGTGCTQ